MLKNLTKQAFFFLYKRSRHYAESSSAKVCVLSTTNAAGSDGGYLIRINITLNSILFNNMYIYTGYIRTHQVKL